MKMRKENNQGNERRAFRFRYRLMAILIAFAMVVQPAAVHSFQTVYATDQEGDGVEVVTTTEQAPAPAETPVVETMRTKNATRETSVLKWSSLALITISPGRTLSSTTFLMKLFLSYFSS